MKETLPLVTIVTITFNLIKNNREKTFRQCLKSVHDQTYGNIEHLVIDGASSDGTVDLIKEYADKGWIRYISEPDKGIYDAMNKGIKMAKGKYVAFLNSDDFYHGREGVAKSVEALEKSQADFSYAPVFMMHEDGKKDEAHPHCNPDIKSVFYTMPFCHQTMFTKRSVLVKEGMFDDSFRSAGDYDIVIRLCLGNYKSVLVNHIFTTFRLGGFSISLRDLSIKEVTMAYCKNYGKLTNISEKECSMIYCTDYLYIPMGLAKALSRCPQYFDYRKYLSMVFFEKWMSKVKFVFLSPKKFIKKYLKF